METQNEQQGLQITSKDEQALQNATGNDEIRMKLQNFTTKLNAQPKPESIGSTPDGRAKTIKISHIETTLDEYFFGMWTTENFRWSQIGNEVVGSIDLKVLHPVAGIWITRQGAASIIIMVDKAPDNITGKDKNLWALDMQNKKSNALDMGFPKLKAECLKNAANSFGSMFGRDLNRKEQDRDVYTPLFRTKPQPTTDGTATNAAA
jgi:hypothetical protein